MTYTPGIPRANDRPSQSQQTIADNFTQANVVFGVNHIEFDDATVANRGRHTFVSLLEQQAAPETLVEQPAIYSIDRAGTSQLFWKYENEGDVVQISNSSTPIAAQNGLTWLPGGLLLQWGRGNIPANPGGNIAFNIAFTGVAFNVQITPYRPEEPIGASTYYVTAITANNFRVSTNRGNGAATDILWIAIGPHA